MGNLRILGESLENAEILKDVQYDMILKIGDYLSL